MIYVYIIIVFILILVAPYDVDTKGNISYSQGDQLALNCTSEGGPQLEYSWVHLGDVISNVSTLIIDNMDTTHGGEYICNVANDAGNDSKNITVYSKFYKYCSLDYLN